MAYSKIFLRLFTKQLTPIQRYNTVRHASSMKSMKYLMTWKSLGLSSIGLFVFYQAAKSYKIYKRDKVEQNMKQSYGKPAIGGPFELIDHNGKPFTSKDLEGKWAILYFGFTHCPDVCPEELEKLANVVDKLEKQVKSQKFVGVFITVDPERDTPDKIATYLKEFSPKFIGLTGTKDAINSVTKRYRVYHSPGPKDKDKDYIVDHTIIMYLLSPKGEFVNYFGQNKTVDNIVDDICIDIMKYKRNS